MKNIEKAVGNVSLGYSEGLVGLVGVREEPINLEHAREHERYCYLPETGEEKLESFLGEGLRSSLSLFFAHELQVRKLALLGIFPLGFACLDPLHIIKEVIANLKC